MIWVAWRQHRAQLLTLAAALLIGGIAVLILSSSMSQYIQEHGLEKCVVDTGSGRDCLQLRMEFQEQWFDLLKAGQAAIVALPVLLGVFSAAPLFSREIEHGTHVLAFTQSVSRLRWMVTKVAMLLVPSLVVLVALQLLVNRWVDAAGQLGPMRTRPFSFLNFDSTGLMPVAYLLFSFAAGALLGALLRRSLVAMISTLGALVAVRVVVSMTHLYAVPEERKVSAPDASTSATQPAGEFLRSGYLGQNGQEIEISSASLSSCGVRGDAPSMPDMRACYEQQGVFGKFVDVIPSSAIPGLQLAEFAAFGVIAVLLLVGTGWTLRRQH